MGRLVLVTLVAWLSAACRQEKAVVVVCHASSLSPLLREAVGLYEPNHPGIAIRLEGSSSLEAIGKVAGEQTSVCDLLAVSDQRLISRFLIPERVSSAFGFLGDEIVLASGRRNLFAAETDRLVWEQSWPEKLTAGQFSLGIVDPNLDPAGYYTHLAWKLAEFHYDRSGLYRRFLNGLNQHWVRSEPSQLVALLESGNIDCAFIFRSTAVHNQLPYIRLPTSVSLGEASQESQYARVFHKVTLARGGDWEVPGAPIRYGLCQVRTSQPSARGFLTFLLGDEVHRLARRQGYLTVPVTEFSR